MVSRSTQHKQDPVTLVFSFNVKKRKEKEFEQWASDITHAASKFEGHLGANWIKPSSQSQHYSVIYKYDCIDHFRAWEVSTERKTLLQRGLELTTHDDVKKLEELTGLETWFTLPGVATIKPPPKWKMVIATMIGIYPLALLMQVLVFPNIEQVPLAFKPLILSLFLTPLMTYIVMPNLTKLLKQWLYPEK